MVTTKRAFIFTSIENSLIILSFSVVCFFVTFIFLCVSSIKTTDAIRITWAPINLTILSHFKSNLFSFLF
ncbi:hypothetical protein A8E67_35545 [Burkholderia cenocepacia]|nr:hypothetical protein A8E67_35545 [Burkholderia cenocepacia]